MPLKSTGEHRISSTLWNGRWSTPEDARVDPHAAVPLDNDCWPRPLMQVMQARPLRCWVTMDRSPCGTGQSATSQA